ncbi:hypothetical protein [Streptomyces sp. NBC_01217]|uniref:hypothetical protein n=1 Tax=Streptomyces sp. NBC_01217 TaxID=2903779 RepID=UPI002E16479B|nr:hypothetical protein OG507_21135 [Streptomyces sp. NBC_01217]
MMRPGLTADGRAVRLPIAKQLLAPVLDDLAIAYAENPVEFGHLLAAHAGSVLRLDHAEVSEDMPDHVRHMRAAEADGTREALLAELPDEHQVDPLLGPDAAITLAGRLTSLAGHIRHTTNRSPRP